MEQFIGDLHKQANDVARESLALDALARELKIEVTEDDINAEFEKAGVKDVEASKAEFIADGRMPAVRESIRRSKAVDHLVENAKVTEVDETAKDAGQFSPPCPRALACARDGVKLYTGYPVASYGASQCIACGHRTFV